MTTILRSATVLGAGICLALLSRQLPAPIPALPGCTTGTPAAITDSDGRSPDAMPLYAAPLSVPWTHLFVVKDASGRPLKNVTVEFSLPAQPSGRFGVISEHDFHLAADAKRAVATTSDTCWGTIPSLVADAMPGRFDLAAQVVSAPAIRASIPVIVVSDALPRLDEAGVSVGPSVVRRGERVAVLASALWSNGVSGGRLGGVAMRFSASTGGPTVKFDNGGGNATAVLTNPIGIARADGAIDATAGIAEVTATLGIESKLAARFTIAGEAVVTAAAPTVIAYGATDRLDAVVNFPWASCERSYQYDILGPVTYKADGMPMGGDTFPAYSWASCLGTTYPGHTVRSDISLAELGFGTHTVSVEYGGNEKVAPARLEIPLTVAHHATLPLADGGTLKLAATSPLYQSAKGSCSLAVRSGTFGTPGWPSSPPAPAESVTALFSLESYNCDWAAIQSGFTGPIVTAPPLARRVLVEREMNLPQGTVAWAYGPTADNASPHWYELRTAASGRSAHFELVDGGYGDDSLVRDDRIRATIALAVPRQAAVAGRFQDLWWAGAQENGWGMSVVQHRDVLFTELFVYDAQGTARWLAIPGGQWNAAKTAFTGNVYRPRSTPYTQAYDVSQFVIGPPVGTATLTLVTQDSMRLDYRIDNMTGTRTMSRIGFGPPDASPLTRFDDLWWGGAAQNGWGLALAQQHRTFFAIWYTYDEQGQATWFVAPSSTMHRKGVLNADLYRPRGSPWLGAAYDPARLSMEKVGTLGFYFGDGWDRGLMVVRVGDFTRTQEITRVPF